MRALGIVRALDDLGRIVIPKELRRSKWGEPKKGDIVELYLEEDLIILQNPLLEGRKEGTVSMTRPFDSLGRIVIPIEMRRYLSIAEKDRLEFYTDEDRIIIKKYESVSSCIFCNEVGNSISFKGKTVCKGCLEELVSEQLVNT